MQQVRAWRSMEVVDAARRRRLAASIAIGTLLNPLNSSMVAVALVRLQQDFGVGVATVTWLVSGFYLTSAVAVPLAGRLADRLGPRRVFLGGLVLVVAVNSAAPLAPGFGWLVAARVLQACGTSVAFPSGLAMLRASSGSGRAPAASLGLLNVANSTSAALGPTLAGFLVALAGWQAIFLVNVPLAALGVGLGLRWMPRDRPAARAAQEAPNLAADLRALLGSRRLLSIYAQFAGVNFVYYSMFLALPLWLQQVRGLPPYEVGLLLLPVAGLGVLVTPAAARSIGRSGPWRSLLVGTVALLAGSALLLLFSAAAPLWLIVASAAMFGMPGGLNTLALQSALYEAAPPSIIGAAGGLFQTCRYVGAILSAILIALVFATGTSTAGLHLLALLLIAVSVVLLVVTSVRALNRPLPDSRLS